MTDLRHYGDCPGGCGTKNVPLYTPQVGVFNSSTVIPEMIPLGVPSMCVECLGKRGLSRFALYVAKREGQTITEALKLAKDAHAARIAAEPVK